MRELAEGAGIEATFCGGGGRSLLYELDSKRAESAQPAAAIPTKAKAKARGQARGQKSTWGRGIWLLTRTQQT
jgi:hypothetical protein